MKQLYDGKSRNLDAKLAAIGEAKKSESLVAEIQSLHCQLKDKALGMSELEDKVDLKNEEIRFLNGQIRDIQEQQERGKLENKKCQIKQQGFWCFNKNFKF